MQGIVLYTNTGAGQDIVIVPLIFQLAVAMPLSALDSAALIDRLHDRHFEFMLDWQRQHWWDYDYAHDGGPVIRHFEPVTVAGMFQQQAFAFPPPRSPRPAELKAPIEPLIGRRCDPEHQYRFDIDQHYWAAHMIKGDHLGYTACPSITRGPVRIAQPGYIDYTLSREARDTVRAHRALFLRELEAAQKQLPGDRWILGQRVRLLVDQGDAQAALRLTQACPGEAWWCTALRGYLYQLVGDEQSAIRTFMAARSQMPLGTRLDWDDVGLFLHYTGRVALSILPDQARDSLNNIAWWLADPLFIEDGNDRLAEHMWRRVNVELRNGGVDIGSDWRRDYQGPVLAEMTVRYGWLGERAPCPKPRPRGGAITDGTPRPNTNYDQWPRNSASSALDRLDDWFQKGRFSGCPMLQSYPGPMFHTFSNWHAITDPFHSESSDWDLAPPRDVGDYWDGSWWAPELYNRKNGPIVPVHFQVAMLRRQTTPMLAAAMSWDTAGYTFPPPPRVVAAAITMTDPAAPRVGTRDTMKSSSLRALFTPILPGPSLLSLEMMPQGAGVTTVPGTAGRARFGIDAPLPLSKIEPGGVAISDPILVRVSDAQNEPRTLADALARMFGTTTLHNPRRIGVFWEAYGFADGDTIDVSVTIVRHDDSGLLRRVGAAAGIGEIRRDSLTIRWNEPRRGDPGATPESGVSVRPRGVVLSIPDVPAGRYTLYVSMARAAASASSRRELVITR